MRGQSHRGLASILGWIVSSTAILGIVPGCDDSGAGTIKMPPRTVQAAPPSGDSSTVAAKVPEKRSRPDARAPKGR